jgi:hypothetical protein
MILASQKFVRAVPEAWFLSTVENDDVKIIKMFYDIPAMVRLWYCTVCGIVPYYDTIPYLP